MFQAISTSLAFVQTQTGQSCAQYSYPFLASTNDCSYASSSEIQSYLKRVCKFFNLERYISLESKVQKSVWDESRGVWVVSVEGQANFEAEILFNASGILNNIKYPHLSDLENFSGELLHTADWDPTISLKGKRIAVVGAGASAIQLLPVVQKVAASVDVYIRTPSWITPQTNALLSDEFNHTYSSKEKAAFREDVNQYALIRKQMETYYNSMYGMFIRDSEEQSSSRQKLEKWMKQRISDSKLQAKLIPKFEVGCRRINPGEAYLEAIQQPNVTPVFDPIDRVVPEGIISDTQIRPAEVIVAATGFDTSFTPRFPIIGSNGVDLAKLWEKDPNSYLGLAVSGFPNYLVFLGPNTPIANGSVIGTLEATADYFVRLLKKFVEEEVHSFVVRPDVQADFNAQTQVTMQKTVWTGTCRSWYKDETGRISAVWPGSSLHYRQVLESNRWEDYDWRYRGNRFAHWGLGFSNIEKMPDSVERDFAYYITSHEPLPLTDENDSLDGDLRQAYTSSTMKHDHADVGTRGHQHVKKRCRSPIDELKVARKKLITA